jgi:hypothetical protein
MDEMREAILTSMKAERNFLRITQAMIEETIDLDFCYEIVEKVQNGMDRAEALETTIEEYGYHLNEKTS